MKIIFIFFLVLVAASAKPLPSWSNLCCKWFGTKKDPNAEANTDLENEDARLRAMKKVLKCNMAKMLATCGPDKFKYKENLAACCEKLENSDGDHLKALAPQNKHTKPSDRAYEVVDLEIVLDFVDKLVRLMNRIIETNPELTVESLTTKLKNQETLREQGQASTSGVQGTGQPSTSGVQGTGQASTSGVQSTGQALTLEEKKKDYEFVKTSLFLFLKDMKCFIIPDSKKDQGTGQASTTGDEGTGHALTTGGHASTSEVHGVTSESEAATPLETMLQDLEDSLKESTHTYEYQFRDPWLKNLPVSVQETIQSLNFKLNIFFVKLLQERLKEDWTSHEKAEEEAAAKNHAPTTEDNRVPSEEKEAAAKIDGAPSEDKEAAAKIEGAPSGVQSEISEVQSEISEVHGAPSEVQSSTTHVDDEASEDEDSTSHDEDSTSHVTALTPQDDGAPSGVRDETEEVENTDQGATSQGQTSPAQEVDRAPSGEEGKEEEIEGAPSGVQSEISEDIRVPSEDEGPTSHVRDETKKVEKTGCVGCFGGTGMLKNPFKAMTRRRKKPCKDDGKAKE